MSDPSSSSAPAEGGENGDTGDQSGLGSWFGGLLKSRSKQRNGENGWRESIEEILEEHAESGEHEFGEEERLMLANIVALGSKRVDDVMVPRGDIVAVDISLQLSDLVARYLEAPHSRLPVYKDQLDDIMGILHIKDLVKYWGQSGAIDLRSILRAPLVVPPSKPVIDLMVEMRANRRHMAIVVDEYGGVDGLVTIEDLIEEIVGDIRDEHDNEVEPAFKENADGTIDVDARFELEEFEERVGCDLLADEEDEEIDTLGGFVFVALGRVPKRGEVIRHDCGLEFEVVEADARRIHRLRVRRDGQNAVAETARAGRRDIEPGRGRPRNRLALAFLLGAITTLVFAPFHILPLGFLGFAGLLWLLSKCGRTPEAFWTGWFFGWGHFIAGLYWIASAFLVEPEKFAWMIPFPTLGLPALLALFTSAATALAWRVAPTGWRRLLALAAAWTLAEMARGWVLTGFPWNLAGYALGAHHLLMQPAAWAGVFGLSFLAVLGFAAPALLAGQNRSPRAAGAALAFVAVILAAGALRPEPAVHAPGAEPVSIRIVQGNIPQREKWRPDRVEPNFRMLLEMSRGFDGDLVIWPETAATFLLSRAPGPLAAIAGVAPPGGHVVTGAPRVEDIGGNERFYNSAILIGSDGRIADSADKHHLVPFGEYLPMRAVLQRIGLDKLAQGRGDFTIGAEDEVLVAGDLPPAALLICYEAIFPARAARADRPGWLLNLTNDGWFGELTGPDQHFDMTRFRAVEQGLPLIRAAGTGISGIIDAYGRIQGVIPLGTKGVLDGILPPPASETLFGRTGSIPVLVIAILLLVVSALPRRGN